MGSKRLFGLEFFESDMDAKDLPVYLTARRSFFRMSCSGIEFILIKVRDDERFGVAALEKQATTIAGKYGIPVAFGFANISKNQRDSLIGRNIPFISESGQMYLPFLGIALHDRFVSTKTINRQKMMPVTQALFLYLLYFGKNGSVLKKDAAEAISVTKTSITRASDQLEAMGLITQETHGKECHMMPNGEGRALFEKAKPFLIDPIQRVITTEVSDRYTSLLLSGESALAARTMLNAPRVPVKAVYKAEIDARQIQDIDIRWNTDLNVIRLELWKYDPRLFGNDGIVDPVSLFMCLANNADERVEGAMEDYLEGYQW